LKRGELVGIFPEGHRSLDGKLLKAKSGSAMLALKARAPVVPIGLINTHAILPKGSAWPRFFTPYQIKIGRPMVFEQYYSEYETARDPAEIEGKVSRAIMREIGHLIGQEYSF
jgi:1-acyl-sn-glycerol-3-phosphate acyltransferase